MLSTALSFDEEILEDLSYRCCERYGEQFLDAVVDYLVYDSVVVLNTYFETIEEAVRRTMVRKATNAMYKNKYGKALVKGIRRAGYGTKFGRKMMSAGATVKRGAGQVAGLASDAAGALSPVAFKAHGLMKKSGRFTDQELKGTMGVAKGLSRSKVGFRRMGETMRGAGERTAAALRRTEGSFQSKQAAREDLRRVQTDNRRKHGFMPPGGFTWGRKET